MTLNLENKPRAILPRSFYDRPAPQVAPQLIGCQLVRLFNGERLAGLITETEAYLGEEDKACHASKGRTPRTEVMYYKCLKLGVLAFLQGTAPQVAVEFARKFLPHDVQPSFQELEEKLNTLPTPS